MRRRSVAAWFHACALLAGVSRAELAEMPATHFQALVRRRFAN